MRIFVAAALAVTLFASQSIADTGTLPAGKPAGARAAQTSTGTVFVTIGLLFAGGVGILIAAKPKSTVTTATTGTH